MCLSVGGQNVLSKLLPVQSDDSEMRYTQSNKQVSLHGQECCPRLPSTLLRAKIVGQLQIPFQIRAIAHETRIYKNYYHRYALNWTSMAQRKISDAVARLIALNRPAYVGGRWQKPAISNTELRMLRRRLVLSGEYWPRKPVQNIGADPPIKPSERELNRPAR